MIDKNQVIDEALKAIDDSAKLQWDNSYAYLFGYTQSSLRLILQDLNLTKKQLAILTKKANI